MDIRSTAAALACLGVAYTSCSLPGLLLLLVFIRWTACLGWGPPPARSTRGPTSSGSHSIQQAAEALGRQARYAEQRIRLWLCAAWLCAAYLLALLVAQALYAAHALASASPHLIWALRLAGLGPSQPGSLPLVVILLAPPLAMLACLLAMHACQEQLDAAQKSLLDLEQLPQQLGQEHRPEQQQQPMPQQVVAPESAAIGVGTNSSRPDQLSGQGVADQALGSRSKHRGRTSSSFSFTGAEEDVFPVLLVPPQPPSQAAAAAPGGMPPCLGSSATSGPAQGPSKPGQPAAVGGAPSPSIAGTSAVTRAPTAVTSIAQRLQQGLSQALKLPSHQDLVGLLGSRDSLSHLSQQASEAQQQVTTPTAAANQQQQQGQSSAAAVPARLTAWQAWAVALDQELSAPCAATALLLSLCALLWPGTLSAVYLLTGGAALLRWAYGGSARGVLTCCARGVHVVTAAHVTLLYLLLTPLTDMTWVLQIGVVLGLYSVPLGLPAGGGAVQVIHQTCLHLLLAALGAVVAAETAAGFAKAQHGTALQQEGSVALGVSSNVRKGGRGNGSRLSVSGTAVPPASDVPEEVVVQQEGTAQEGSTSQLTSSLTSSNVGQTQSRTQQRARALSPAETQGTMAPGQVDSAPQSMPGFIAATVLTLVGAIMAVTDILSGSVLAATVLLASSVVQLSAFSFVMLSLGLLVVNFTGPSTRRAFARVSPGVTVLLATWLVVVYCLTAVRAYSHYIPPSLDHLWEHLLVARPRPLLDVGLEAVTLLVIAALARKTALRLPSSTSPPASSPPSVTATGASTTTAGATTRQSVRGSSHDTAPSAGGLISQHGHPPPAGPLSTTTTTTAPAPQGAMPPGSFTTRSAPSLSEQAAVEGLWYLGCILVPAAWVGAGLARPTLLHMVYLLVFALTFSPGPLVLPMQRWTLAPPPQHVLVRTYASLHLLALYAARCGRLPGLEFLQPPELEDVLKLVGFWSPSLLRDCLPVLACLTLCTLHGVMGRWLSTRGTRSSIHVHRTGSSGSLAAVTGAPVPAATHSSWQTPLAHFKGFLANNSPLLVAPLIWFLVLGPSPAGLMSAAYLVQAALLLQLALPASKHPGGQSQTDVGLAITTSDRRPSDSHTSMLQQIVPPRLAGRVAVVLLQLYTCADLLLQLGLQALEVARPDLLTGDVRAFLMDILGTYPPPLSAHEYMWAVLRPSLILGALQLYSWIYQEPSCDQPQGAQGSPLASTSRQPHPAHSPPSLAPTHDTLRHLRQQCSWAWFLRRLIILHIDKALVLLVFVAFLKVPGALGLSLLAGTVCTAPLLSGHQLSWSPQHQGGQAGKPVLARASITVLQAVVLLWLLADYLLQVPWVIDSISPLPALDWLGLHQRWPGGLSALHTPLSILCIMLWATGLRTRAWSWLSQLPAAVRAAAQPGRPCPLLWPPADPVALARAIKVAHGVGHEGAGGTAMSSARLDQSPPMGAGLGWVPEISEAQGTRQAERLGLGEERALLGAPFSPLSPSGLSGGVTAIIAPVQALVGPLLQGLSQRALSVMRAMDIPTPGSHDDGVGADQQLIGGGREAQQQQEDAGEGEEGTTFAVEAPVTVGLAAGTKPHALFQAAAPSSDTGDGDKEAGTSVGAVADICTPHSSFLADFQDDASSSSASLVDQAIAAANEYELEASQQQAEGGQRIQRGRGSDQGVQQPRRQIVGDAAKVAGEEEQDEDQPEQEREGQAWVMIEEQEGRASPLQGLQQPSATSSPWASIRGTEGGSGLPMGPPPAAGTSQASSPARHYASGPSYTSAGGYGMGGSTGAAEELRDQGPTLSLDQQIVLVYNGCCTTYETAWTVWGLDLSCLFLLIAAYAQCNVTSLALMAAVVLGSVAPGSKLRACAWSRILVPLLAASLALHAASWVGWEQLLPGFSSPPISPQLMQWLGLAWVPAQSLWALLAAYAAAVMQAHSDWAQVSAGGSTTTPGTAGNMSGDMSATASSSATRGRRQGKLSINVEDESSSLQVPLLQEGELDIEQGPLPAQHFPTGLATPGLSTTGPGPYFQAPDMQGVEEDAAPQKLPRLFSPVTAAHQPHWHWLDWGRYIILRHSLDALLVSVVLLCALQRDLVHAGYLALALFLFRKRTELRQPAASGPGGPVSRSTRGSTLGRAPFVWLPAFNLTVIALQLLYQAPLWTFLFGRELDNPCRPWQPPVQSSPSPGFVSHQGSWPDAVRAGGDPGTHGPRCTLPELLGFCRFVLVPDETPNAYGTSWGSVGAPGPSPLASLLVSSALADLILWGVLRAYAKLAASQAYQEVLQLLAERRMSVVREVEALRREQREAQAREALSASSHQAARARRIARLKALFTDGGSGPDGAPAAYESLASVTGLAQVLDSDGHHEPQHLLMTASPSGAHLLGHGTVASSLGPGHAPPGHQPTPAHLPPGVAGSFTSTAPGTGWGRRQTSPSVTHFIRSGASRKLEAEKQQGWWGRWVVWLRRRQIRRDEESYVVYGAFLLLLCTDMSLVACLVPLTAWCYALLAQSKPHTYWRALLVWAEALLVLQYAAFCVTQCLCHGPDDGSAVHHGSSTGGSSSTTGSGYCGGTNVWARLISLFGFHDSVAACLPLFLSYLAALTHTFHLSQTAPQDSHSSPASTSFVATQPQQGSTGAGRIAEAPGSFTAGAGRPPLPVSTPAHASFSSAGFSYGEALGLTSAGQPGVTAERHRSQELQTMGGAPTTSPGLPGTLASAPGVSTGHHTSPAAHSSPQPHGPTQSAFAAAPLQRHGSFTGQGPGSGAPGTILWAPLAVVLAGGQALGRGLLTVAWHVAQAYRVSGSSHEHPLHWVVLTLEFKRSKEGPHAQAPGAGPASEAPGAASSSAEGGHPLKAGPAVHAGTEDAVTVKDESLGGYVPAVDAVTTEELQELEGQLNAAAKALHRLSRQQHSSRAPHTSGGPGHTSTTTNTLGSIRGSGSTGAAESAIAGQLSYLRVDKVLTAPAGEGAGPAAVSVLCEVVPQKLQPPETAAGLWHEIRHPVAALAPAADAAALLSQLAPKNEQLSAPAAKPGSAAEGNAVPPSKVHSHSAACSSRQQKAVQHIIDVLPWKLHSLEAHARHAHDYYAWTVFVDVLSFLYAALFYQFVLGSTRYGRGGEDGEELGGLGDTTRTLPADYLAALMALFLLMVADRTVYTLGSCRAKLFLHLLSIALILPWCLVLAWAPTIAPSAGRHLRVFLLLRAVGWILSALQLRSGYPPLSAFGPHPGRHSFLFYRVPDLLHFRAYNVFMALPLLYEIRTLLDWTCTSTTLDWYSWLKLEDIRGSLFVAAARRRMQAARQLGEKIPRYQKFLEGILILSFLLLILWLPPLVFSTGAPTYITPRLESVSVNVTIGQVVAESDVESVMSFLLYSGGNRFATRNWGLIRNANSSSPSITLPPSLSSNYEPEQVKLLCMTQDSDRLWTVSPPGRAALMELLVNGSDISLTFNWAVTRSAPLANGRGGGPTCVSSLAVPLSGRTRADLVQVLQGSLSRVRLMALNSSDSQAADPDHGGPLGLFPLFWRARGEACIMRAGLASTESQAAGVLAGTSAWGFDWHTYLSRGTQSDAETMERLGGDEPGKERGWQAGAADWSEEMVSCTLGLVSGSGGRPGGNQWWELGCEPLDAQGVPVPEPSASPDLSQTLCPAGQQGPQMTLVIEKVQGGLLGSAISSFGLTGLYITFVFGIARLLRLSIANLRLKIPSEDLPTTRHLVTLCQDIYIARADNELVLEAQLYRALINIYRSPAVLFELTRKRAKTKQE